MIVKMRCPGGPLGTGTTACPRRRVALSAPRGSHVVAGHCAHAEVSAKVTVRIASNDPGVGNMGSVKLARVEPRCSG
jgi:hypothetical protein